MTVRRPADKDTQRCCRGCSTRFRGLVTILDWHETFHIFNANSIKCIPYTQSFITMPLPGPILSNGRLYNHNDGSLGFPWRWRLARRLAMFLLLLWLLVMFLLLDKHSGHTSKALTTTKPPVNRQPGWTNGQKDRRRRPSQYLDDNHNDMRVQNSSGKEREPGL